MDYLHTKYKRHNINGSWQSDTKLKTSGELSVLLSSSISKLPKQNKYNFDNVLPIILLHSRTLCRLCSHKCTDMSEVSVFCNVGTLLRDHTASYRGTERSLIDTSVITFRLTPSQHFSSVTEVV